MISASYRALLAAHPSLFNLLCELLNIERQSLLRDADGHRLHRKIRSASWTSSIGGGEKLALCQERKTKKSGDKTCSSIKV